MGDFRMVAFQKAMQLGLINRKANVEFRLQQISHKRTQLANIMGQQQQGNSPQGPNQALKIEDQRLELEQKNFETQLKIIQTHEEATKKQVDKNVDFAYKSIFG